MKSLWTLLRRNVGRKNQPITHKPHLRLWLESLEDRITPASFVDNFEGAAINPYWQTFGAGYVTFPSTAAAHSGSQSVQFNTIDNGQQKAVGLVHDFAAPTYGTFSVWVYDTAADIASSNYLELTVYERGGRGVRILTQDYDFGGAIDGQYIVDANAYVEQGIPSGIDRTQGWHQFAITCRPDGVEFRVDGTLVYTDSRGLAVDALNIDMFGPSWRPAWVSYFDDFEFVDSVENSDPTVNPAGPYATTYGSGVTLAGSGSDADGDTLAYTWTVNGHAFAPSANASRTLTWADLQAGGVTTAGTYAVHLSADDGHGGVTTSADVVMTIDKATSSVAASPAGSPFTYDTTTHTGGSAVVSGIGDGITQDVTWTYSGDQVNAGTYTATATYAGDANHYGSSGSATITIDKATSSVSVTATSFTYNNAAQSHGAWLVSGVGTGITQAVTWTYTGDRVNAGTYTATATYAGDANHYGSSGSATMTIDKATSSVSVTATSFTYNNAAQSHGAWLVSGVGTGITQDVTWTYSGDRINAGTYTAIATYAGDANHYGSSGSATMTIQPKQLAASASSQGTINIGSNGSIVLHLSIDGGQLYQSDTIASLFSGAAFTIAVQRADGGVTYGTLTSTAKIESDGSITITLKMDNSLRALLYDAYINGRAVNFNLSATANGGNYLIDEDTMSKLLNNGAFRYVV